MSELNIDEILGTIDEELIDDLPNLPPLTARDEEWLACYLDCDSPTFFNASASARAIGHKCKRHNMTRAGWRHKKKCLPHIEYWLDEEGFDESTLKGKLINLIGAETTKFFQHEGFVMEERNVGDNASKLKALDMAFKLKGMYAADEVKVTGLGKLAERLIQAHQRAKDGRSSD